MAATVPTPNFLAFDIALLLPRLQIILAVFIKFPGAYLPIIGSWIFTAIYFVMHPSEHPGHTYAMSTGIALAFTAISVIFQGIATYSVAYGSVGFYLMVGLIVYGALLIVLGMVHAIPEVVADILGDPGHVLIPTLLALFYIDGSVPVDLTTFVAITVPVGAFIIAKYIRGATGAQ